MASIMIAFTGVPSASNLGIGVGRNAIDPRAALQNLDSFIWGLMQGANSGTYDVVTSATDSVKASAEVTATTSGSLGTVINGTTVTTAFTTDQDGTAAKAVADINANTTVNKWVTASKSGTNKFVVTANVAGAIGNCCTLTVTGTGASATGSGKLINGAGNDAAPTTFTVG